MTLPLSPLERAVVEFVATRHWPGFRVDEVAVSRREDTGVGRYIYFEDEGDQPLVDGSYSADGHFIEMEGIPNGIFFVIEVSNSRISYLELVTCGNDSWDGVERGWKIA